VSIDTYHAETARLAVEAGAEIVNDVSGHLWDSAMAATCAQLGCGAILMHTRGRPWQWRTQPPLAPDEVVPLVLGDLRERAQAAVAAGIARDSIVLDPGFGFGKIGDENYPLLARFDALHALGYALLAGVSRKSFLTRTPGFRPTANPGAPSQTALSSEVGILGAPHLAFDTREPGAPHLASEMWELGRELPTTVANTAAILAGAHILRVHDVPPALQAAAIADRVLAAIA
jgi:dihydropteroate synthase